MKKLKLIINVDLGKNKKGSFVDVECNENKTPVDKYWRRRLRENSVSIFEERKLFHKKITKTKPTKEVK